MADYVKDESTIPFVMVQNEIIDSEDAFQDGYEKMVYIVLKRHANLNGENAFPSIATIAKKAVTSEATVKRRIASLVKKGLITKENRINPNKGGKTSNLYTLKDFNRWVRENHRDRSEGAIAIGQSDPSRWVRVTHEEDTSLKKSLINSSTTSENEKKNNVHPLYDPDIRRVISCFENNISASVSPFVTKNLEYDIEDHGADMVIHAIEETALNNVRNYKYMKSILDRWQDEGIKTVEQAKANSKQRAEQFKKKGGKSRGTSKRVDQSNEYAARGEW